ncbi:hypothetical protein ZWY2020_031031 [Hordeum vulgare]|nr:hypothetical protein ZWY2020_031031 [Hordeum vulgare]
MPSGGNARQGMGAIWSGRETTSYQEDADRKQGRTGLAIALQKKQNPVVNQLPRRTRRAGRKTLLLPSSPTTAIQSRHCSDAASFVAASGPDDHAFVRCASGCDSWAPPRPAALDGDSYRLCPRASSSPTPRPTAPPAPSSSLPRRLRAASSREAHVDFSPGPTAAWAPTAASSSRTSPASRTRAPSSAPPRRRPRQHGLFSYEYDLAEWRVARVILTAALLAPVRLARRRLRHARRRSVKAYRRLRPPGGKRALR